MSVKTLKTPRGTLPIREEFNSRKEAQSAGYGIYFSHGDVDVYTKPVGPDRPHSVYFAIVNRC